MAWNCIMYIHTYNTWHWQKIHQDSKNSVTLHTILTDIYACIRYGRQKSRSGSVHTYIYITIQKMDNHYVCTYIHTYIHAMDMIWLSLSTCNNIKTSIHRQYRSQWILGITIHALYCHPNEHKQIIIWYLVAANRWPLKQSAQTASVTAQRKLFLSVPDIGVKYTHYISALGANLLFWITNCFLFLLAVAEKHVATCMLLLILDVLCCRINGFCQPIIPYGLPTFPFWPVITNQNMSPLWYPYHFSPPKTKTITSCQVKQN